MRILHLITRSEIGGAQSVVANLAVEQRALGHEVAIASGPEGGGEAWQGLGRGITILTVPGLQRAVAPVQELRALGGLSRTYREWKPDIVNLHTSKAGLLGRLAPGLPRRHIVYTMHGYFQLRDINRKFLFLDKALKGLCGAIVAVSRMDQAQMEEDGYAPVCIPNGIPDTRSMAPQAPELVARLKALKEGGRVLIMVIARDASFKRLDLAREVAASLGDKAWVVWLGGDPQAGDPEGFLALGAWPQASAYLRYADIYLQPSNHEGLSMSLLEGLSAGIPCVASSVGGNIECLGQDPRSVQDGGVEGPLYSDYGVLVPNRAGVMAEVVSGLCAEPGRRQAMGRAARAAYEARYSSPAMARAYLELYKGLA